MPHNDLILTLSCPDRTGIVYRVSGLLFELGCNILDSQQFGDEETGRFFLRVHFDLPAPIAQKDLRDKFGALAADYGMEWHIHDARIKPRLLIMASRQGHCLNDLLFRVGSGQLHAEIASIVSNHEDYAGLAASYGIPFHHLPVTPGTKEEQEKQVLALVEHERVDLVVLARYMQILSDPMCRALEGRAINIHHSFLPSFKGARPYHQAYERGVKLIGATAHYVTSDLDEGPIIEQEVARIDHSMPPEQLVGIGRDMECVALARAIQWHAEHRVLLNGNRTVVFR